MIRACLLICLVLLGSAPSFGAVDVYEFSSEDRRERYQKFIEELRCPKCKNNNLAGTNSQIAEDLRRELYKMVEEGKSDKEIIDFMVARYGDFVLYRPPVQKNTLALWFAPLVLFGVGLIIIGVVVWSRRRLVKTPSAELSEEDKAELDKLLTRKEGSKEDAQ